MILFRYLMRDTHDDEVRDDVFTYFERQLKTEISFIMFQVAKVICVFGGDSFGDLVSGKNIIKQATSFRSYFLLKLILLCDLDDLLAIMNDSIPLSEKRLILFGELINKAWDNFISNTHNVGMIDRFIRQCQEAFEKNDDRWIFRTCRMSVNDINDDTF